MSLSRLIRIAFLASSTLLAVSAHADTFSTGGYYSGDQNNFTTGLINYSYNGTSYSDAAGNLTGSTGVIGGQAYSFTQTYCIDLLDVIYLNTPYTATYSSNGVAEGAAVNNAGEIAWLLTNRAPLDTTTAQNEALQAAIWSVEYPLFTMGTNNSDVMTAYNNDLQALGSKTASVSSVGWVTPVNANGSYAQAQVILTPAGPMPNVVGAAMTPEPSSLVLLGTGILGVAGAARQRFTMRRS